MSSSRVMRTCRARAAVSTAKVLMPGLQELLLMTDDKSLDLPQFDGAKPCHPGEGDLLQPELRQAPLTLDVDMWRFGALVAVEEESVCAYPNHSRHCDDLVSSGRDCLVQDFLCVTEMLIGPSTPF